MFCVFDLKLFDLEALAMLRKIKIDSWRNPIKTFEKRAKYRSIVKCWLDVG